MRIAAVALILATALGPPAAARDGGDVGPRAPGTFDYYVLSLTWVPGFCATRNDPLECGRGLAPADYFGLSASDARKVVVPAAYRKARALGAADAAALKRAFRAANPGLPAGGVTTVVTNGQVTEARICISKQGAFRACPAN